MTDLPEMPCRELVERVTDYLDGALSADDRLRLETHLAECDPCELYIEQLRETLRLAGSLAPEDVSEPMRSQLLQAFSAWKSGHA